MLSASASGRTVLHDIETVVIDWTHQVRDVLKKDSAQPLLEGLNPNPYVEIEFWNAKAQNLRCIYDQVILSSFLFLFDYVRYWPVKLPSMQPLRLKQHTIRYHTITDEY